MLLRHPSGRERVVYVVTASDLTAGRRVTVQWPLGECYALDLDTGQLVPDAHQDGRVAAWRATPRHLAQLRRQHARAVARPSRPIAFEPADLR